MEWKMLDLSNVKKDYYLISEEGIIKTMDGRPVFRDPADINFVLLLSEKEQSYRRVDLKKLVIKMFVPKPPFCWVFIDENAPGEINANKMRYQMSYDFSRMSEEEAELTRLRCRGLFEWAKYNHSTGAKNISAASVLTYYYQFNSVMTSKEQVLMDTGVTEKDFDWFWRQYNLGYNTADYTPTTTPTSKGPASTTLPFGSSKSTKSTSTYKGTPFRQ